MKTMIASVLVVLALSGCVAVPYHPGPSGYYYDPGYYYGPPAASFSFNYSYRDGGHRHHGRRHR